MEANRHQPDRQNIVESRRALSARNPEKYQTVCCSQHYPNPLNEMIHVLGEDQLENSKKIKLISF